ncbi:MAG TPA: hypothetical protein VJK54_05530, partial [Chthoniobacterales bacterium]|nr:hypothetical protein [Chthoniobacterales bacterium]
MKKIIPTFLLTTLASSSLIFAANKTTNYNHQVTGYRLQALSREQGAGNRMKNRLEATNQATGYRLQATGSRRRELGPEDQIAQQTETIANCELPTANYDNSAGSLNCYLIDQGAELTANCQLPTANCNNSDQDLKCYLMMDPAELKNIQEGIEDLKGVLGSPKKEGLGVSTTAHSSVGSSSSSAAMSRIRDSEPAAILAYDETAEGNSTNIYLEDEICNNIYTSCLARVAEMSRSKSIV